MFKWVACLCAALYFTLLVFGEPPESEEQAATVAKGGAEVEEVSATIEETPVELVPAVATEDVVAATPAVVEEENEIAATPAPEVVTESLDPGVTPVVAVEPAAAPAATSQTASAAAAPPVEETSGVGEIWTVTGSAVNLRAGATTQAAVLGRTVRGDSAEIIELLDNGWAKVYILESGLEAYMSAKFLAPANG